MSALRLGALLLLLLAACLSHGPLDEDRPLRVGIAPIYPPFAFLQDGRLAGVEVDFASRLGAELGRELVLVETPWDELIGALRAGRIDLIMSGMSITAERAREVAFATPYLRIGQMLLVRRSERARLSDPKALATPLSRVGVHRNTTGEFYARAELPRAKIRAFDSIEEGVAALRRGELDYFVHDAPTVWRVVGRPADPDPELDGIYRPLTREDLAWALPLREVELRERLDQALARWRASGQLDEILDYWIPVRRVAVDTAPPR
jgi:ABC-type amino acid transport substrate-binding protein